MLDSNLQPSLCHFADIHSHTRAAHHQRQTAKKRSTRAVVQSPHDLIRAKQDCLMISHANMSPLIKTPWMRYKPSWHV